MQTFTNDNIERDIGYQQCFMYGSLTFHSGGKNVC